MSLMCLTWGEGQQKTRDMAHTRQVHASAHTHVYTHTYMELLTPFLFTCLDCWKQCLGYLFCKHHTWKTFYRKSYNRKGPTASKMLLRIPLTKIQWASQKLSCLTFSFLTMSYEFSLFHTLVFSHEEEKPIKTFKIESTKRRVFSQASKEQLGKRKSLKHWVTRGALFYTHQPNIVQLSLPNNLPSLSENEK